MDLDVNMRCGDSPYIVKFYGAMFREGDVWICMELMDESLDKLYSRLSKVGDSIPEEALGVISVAVVKALEYLHKDLNVMHRDVKPSNILISGQGHVKMCDFGISAQLVDSVAKTMDAGCEPYMAPERIDPPQGKTSYDIKSDVWSFGITMIELATGKFPYAKWKTPFDKLKNVVEGPSPVLPDDFSPVFREFISLCVKKKPIERPNYITLLAHEFIQIHENSDFDTAAYFSRILDS